MSRKKTGIVFFILLLFALTATAQDIQIGFETLTPSDTITICGNSTFTYRVSNLGEFVETFDIGVEPFAETSLLSVNPLVISPGETREIELYLFPGCDQYGSFDVILSLQERTTGTTFEQSSLLDITPIDVAEVAPEVETLRVDYNTVLLEIPVKNVGVDTATYDVFLEGESWLSVRSDTLTVGSGQTEAVEIVSAPQEDTESGNYALTLVVTSTTTGLEYAKEFTVRLKEPTLLDDLLTVYLSFTIAALVLLGLLIFCLMLFIIYLIRTKEERAFRKEERRREKERRKEDKRLAKEEKRRLKEEARLENLKAKEEARRIREEDKEARKKEKDLF